MPADDRNIVTILKLRRQKRQGTPTVLTTAYDNLKNDLNETFNDHIFSNGTTPSYLKNTTGLIDGNTYGILFNPEGVAVESPLKDREVFDLLGFD